MYVSPIGGSALLHLLAAHPRLVAAIGIGAVVAMVANPYGSGRYVGTADYLERIENSLPPSDTASAARRSRAESEVTRMLERNDTESIQQAVAAVLHRCGKDCTDVSVATIVDDPRLLRAVLTLDALDRAVEEDGALAGE